MVAENDDMDWQMVVATCNSDGGTRDGSRALRRGGGGGGVI